MLSKVLRQVEKEAVKMVYHAVRRSAESWLRSVRRVDKMLGKISQTVNLIWTTVQIWWSVKRVKNSVLQQMKK